MAFLPRPSGAMSGGRVVPLFITEDMKLTEEVPGA